jgi:hypothetical protein
MPSPAYELFEEAMRRRKQILCMYDGYPRELCPIILGRTDGQEVALTYQFAGRGSKRLPPGGQWKCLYLSKVSDVQLRDGTGMPVTGICSARAVSSSSISTSIPTAHTTRCAAAELPRGLHRMLSTAA